MVAFSPLPNGCGLVQSVGQTQAKVNFLTPINFFFNGLQLLFITHQLQFNGFGIFFVPINCCSIVLGNFLYPSIVFQLYLAIFCTHKLFFNCFGQFFVPIKCFFVNCFWQFSIPINCSSIVLGIFVPINCSCNV